MPPRGHQLLACLATQASWASPAPLHVAAFATWIPTRPPFRHLPPTPSCRSTNHLRKESLRLYSSQSGGGGGGGGGGTHTLQRLYVAVPLTPSCALELSDEQSHYLRNVLRCRDGTQLRLFNGRDGEYLASVEADVDGGGSGGGGRGGKRARASGQVRLRVAAGPPLRRQPGSAEEARDGSAADAGDGGGGSVGGAALQASLFFAAIKPKPMKLVVEKATELGVCGLQPLISDRAQVKKGDVEKQLGKLGAVALEAAEQSERLTVPPIFPPQTLKVAVQQWLGDAGDDGAERVVVVCEERYGSRPHIYKSVRPHLSQTHQPSGHFQTHLIADGHRKQQQQTTLTTRRRRW